MNFKQSVVSLATLEKLGYDIKDEFATTLAGKQVTINGYGKDNEDDKTGYYTCIEYPLFAIPEECIVKIKANAVSVVESRAIKKIIKILDTLPYSYKENFQTELRSSVLYSY